MANTAVEGRVVAVGTTNGLSGIKVQVVDFDGIPDEQSLGWTTTGADGRFGITYLTDSYRSWNDRNPDIVVRFYDGYLRLLHETPEASDVTDATLDIGNIEIHPDHVAGWLVTHPTLDPTTAVPVALSQGNKIEFLIDNEVAWARITDAISAAVNSINFMILYFDVDNTITKFMPAMPPNGIPVQGIRLEDQLLAKAGPVPVRVLANNFVPDLFGIVDTAGEMTSFFRGTQVEFRLWKTVPQAPMHAKLLIIDGVDAYLIGSPLLQEYFDAYQHLVFDPRRGSMGLQNAIKLPIHEVSTKVRGPAVEHIDRTFTLHWNKQAPDAPVLRPAVGQAAEAAALDVAAVQVTRTLPGNLFAPQVVGDPNILEGETGILESYQRAIANAEDYIYIEDQYFTSFDLIRTLMQRLMLHNAVQVILVLNLKVDIPGYSYLQPRAIRQLADAADRAGVKDRIGIFSLWSHANSLPLPIIMPNYVHSKTAIVDGKWATVGSANTDGTSLNETQVADEGWTSVLTAVGLDQIGRPTQHANPQRQLQPYRATELNLAIYNDVAGQPATALVESLRKRLWAEHLGYLNENDPALQNRPAGGWLALWKQLADHKLDGLKNAPTNEQSPRILPWVTLSDPTEYLQVLGVNTANLVVKHQVSSFDFSTGTWEED